MYKGNGKKAKLLYAHIGKCTQAYILRMGFDSISQFAYETRDQENRKVSGEKISNKMYCRKIMHIHTIIVLYRHANFNCMFKLDILKNTKKKKTLRESIHKSA